MLRLRVADLAIERRLRRFCCRYVGNNNQSQDGIEMRWHGPESEHCGENEQDLFRDPVLVIAAASKRLSVD
jgi:hypothetical protein